MKIDSHQHFWDISNPQFDYSWTETDAIRPIHKTFLPSDLKPHLDACGVDRCVFVQTQHDLAENRWALELAEEFDWIAGVVGWLDLASENCENQLLEFIQHPKFVGVRHITHDEPNDDFIVDPKVLRGLKVLEKHCVPFDLLFFVKHLHHAETLGKELPDLPMVIDHLAKPEIRQGKVNDWRDSLIAASKYPNIHCKLSGLVTESDWSKWKLDDLKPYVELALQHFGPERCMYGSDWPVCELAGTYCEVHDALEELIEGLSKSEKAAIWSQTATKFYGLNV